MTAPGGGDGVQARGSGSRVDDLVVLAAYASVAGYYLVMGAGLIMDDWWSLRNVYFDGPLAAAGDAQWAARPAGSLVYALLFGVVGDHPVLLVVILSMVNLAAVVLLRRVLAVFLPRWLALAVVVVWIALPNQTSLEVWPSTTNIAVSRAALLGAALLLTRRQLGPGGLAGLVVLLLVAVLSYEASVVAGAAAVALLPWLANRCWQPRAVVASSVALAASGIWAATHVNPDKAVQAWNLQFIGVLPANLGWGVGAPGVLGDLTLVGGLAVIAFAAYQVARRAAGPGEQAIVAGAAVIVVGAVPFARYVYEPLGGGDRVNYLSSIGGALVWAGCIWLVVRWRWLAVAASVGLMAIVIPAHATRLARWHRAGEDAAAIVSAVRAQFPDPPKRLGVGPVQPFEANVTPFADDSMIEAALQRSYGDPTLQVSWVFGPEFDRLPEDGRFDVRPHVGLQVRTRQREG